MSLSIKSAQSTCTFEYKGENSELWIQSVRRILNDPTLRGAQYVVGFGDCVDSGNYEGALNKLGIHAVKDRVKLPEFYVTVERILTQISRGEWSQIDKDFDRDQFKAGIRHVWALAIQEGLLTFEQEVLECLYKDGNGGLSVDTIVERLWKQGILKPFSEVRRALEHLCVLYIVERCNTQFSPRYGMLDK